LVICQFCIDCDGVPRFLAKDYEWSSYFAPKGTVKRHELVPSTATCPFNQPCHLRWRSEFCLIPCDRGDCVGTGNSCKKEGGRLRCDRTKCLRTISRTAHSTSSTIPRVRKDTCARTCDSCKGRSEINPPIQSFLCLVVLSAFSLCGEYSACKGEPISERHGSFLAVHAFSSF
ncbi:hypothetical protein EDD17DRAFT_1634832, partial [Pisolithus thermaeus]